MNKYFTLIYFAERYIFNVLSSEAGAPIGPGPLAFCHPRHPVVTPIDNVTPLATYRSDRHEAALSIHHMPSATVGGALPPRSLYALMVWGFN
jgi:hypothetical protein